ncbi:hypothetical protein CF640_37880, partial [Burkholderia pseudomallei]
EEHAIRKTRGGGERAVLDAETAARAGRSGVPRPQGGRQRQRGRTNEQVAAMGAHRKRRRLRRDRAGGLRAGREARHSARMRRGSRARDTSGHPGHLVSRSQHAVHEVASRVWVLRAPQPIWSMQ